ncbi:MAG: adenylate/guanylate cyclase domain-containing protein [Dokdonella sp.]
MTEQRTLTILFADVSGSTKLFETLGDVRARDIIAATLRALLDVAQGHGGRLIKTIGDEIMCTFPSALQGLLAATDMQRRVKSDAKLARENIGIRIGLHHGDVLAEDGDVFGDAVNVAGRMSTLARRDQIVASAATASGITHAIGLRVRSLGGAHVAGKALPIEIVDVLWQEGTADVTTVQRVISGDETAPERARLRVRHGDQSYELDAVTPCFTLGRDPGNSLVIEADWVSRLHAALEWKRGYFTLSDRSTNGTWLRIGDDDELHVHRDEVHLRKSGTISLGRAYQPDSPDTLRFDCEGGP